MFVGEDDLELYTFIHCLAGVSEPYETPKSCSCNWSFPASNRSNPHFVMDNEIMKSSNQAIRPSIDEPTKQTYDQLSFQNYEDLFRNDQVKWFVDDTNVYRVSIHRTLEGNLTTEPMNGAIFIFNPKTGQLFLRIIHKSELEGQKGLCQLAKLKTAEEVAVVARSLPDEEQPNQIIATRMGLLQPLEANLLKEFPRVVILGCKWIMPLQACVKVEKLNELIKNATQSQLHQFNFYDDWLSKRVISSEMAFTRLIMILRSLHLNKESAEMLLKPDERSVTEPAHFWPSLTDEQWMKVEINLEDLIISEYGARNDSVNISALTRFEIRNVIFGGEVISANTI